MNRFPATRQEALQRLDEFLVTAPRYTAERNYVAPGHPNVSRLSAAIRHRLITEEEVVGMALGRHSFRSIEKWLQEVLWRGYWKGWLEARPKVWDQYRESAQDLSAHLDSTQAARCRDIAEGRSGSGIMNHFARELGETGYLHNHARMWWASYWIHHCGLPWELGADHFFQHLLDADPASNTLSWRWVAGLQTRGKAYVATSQNILKFCAPEIVEQSGGVGFDDGVESAAIADDNFGSEAMTELPPLPNGIPHEQRRVAVLLHDEDFCLETSPAARLSPAMVLQFEPTANSPLPVPRADWLGEARADAGKRAGEHFHAGVHVCCSCDEIASACAADRIERLVMMEPFVGPPHDHLQDLPRVLSHQGVAIVRLRRQWDTRLMPHASRGFFPFWNKVGRLLEKSGVEELS